VIIVVGNEKGGGGKTTCPVRVAEIQLYEAKGCLP
jgi:cellulose biosynthesis protein BcsQ